jgi:iron-sulfur cluster assembly protein
MIEITENAARQIHKMLSKRALGESGLRLAVKAGGCSGFEYVFGWDATPRQGDEVFESVDGAKVFVDARSLRVLDGTVLDYDTSLLSKGFLLNNPHAKSTCGCGVSFSIEQEEGVRG